MAYFIGRKLEPIVINYSTVEAERIASVILNNTINLDSDIFDTDFFTITKDSEGNIQLIDFNSKTTNEILNSINQQALEKLNDLEKGESKDLVLSDSLLGTRFMYLKNGIVCDIPLGTLLNNTLLVNLSPSIPIRFSFVGTVNSNLTTSVKEYGFNNALIEIGIEVTIKLRITMPHSTKNIPITTSIILAAQIIQGGVPLYYNGSFTSNSHDLTTKTE